MEERQMIPKTFELLGRKWTVKLIEPDEAFFPNQGASGYTDPNTATVYIIMRKEESSEYRTITFLHELLHAIWFSRGLGFGDEGHNEQEIESTALLLHQYEKTKKGEVEV